MRLLPRVRTDGSAGSRNGTRASAAAEDRGNATCHTVCNSSEAEDSCGAAGRSFSYGLQMGFWRGQSGYLHLYPSSLSSLPRYYHHIRWRCRSTASLPWQSARVKGCGPANAGLKPTVSTISETRSLMVSPPPDLRGIFITGAALAASLSALSSAWLSLKG